MDRFRYYNPTQDEIAMAARSAQTEVQDTRKNRIENRFGHPALHAELFTPMLHADMMRLLPSVYNGRLETESTKLQEYGGQKTEDEWKTVGSRELHVRQFPLLPLQSSLRSAWPHSLGC